jgi:hypothetical protein
MCGNEVLLQNIAVMLQNTAALQSYSSTLQRCSFIPEHVDLQSYSRICSVVVLI